MYIDGWYVDFYAMHLCFGEKGVTLSWGFVNHFGGNEPFKGKRKELHDQRAATSYHQQLGIGPGSNEYNNASRRHLRAQVK